MKKIAGIIALLVVLLLVVPFLIPTSTYMKSIENAAGEAINQPVSIGSMHIALLPSPRANVGDIVIGAKQEVRVKSIAIVPVLSSLFSSIRVIDRIEIIQPSIQKDALDFMAAMPKSSPGGAPKVLVKRILVKRAALSWPGLHLPEMNAEVMMEEGRRMQSVHLGSDDGHLKANVTPVDRGYGIQVDAQNWTMPFEPQIRLDALTASMVLRGEQLSVEKMDAALYQGHASASAVVDWGQGMEASGKFDTKAISAEGVAQLFSKKKLVSGKINGAGTFKVKAKDVSRAAESLVLDYKFDVDKGVLYGVDLAKAATLLLNSGEKGGETQFDTLSGILHMVGKLIELKQLNVVSGLLAANGGVKVLPSRQLDGLIKVELKKGVALATVPLQVSGTLDNPSVMPTKAALAGAAIGTGVLGPGVGTSLGVKAASGVDTIKGLFGK